MRAGGAIEIGIQHFGNVEREIETDEIGLLHRPEHRHARARALPYDDIDGFSVADAGRD